MLEGIKHVHLIGIGGSGLSAIALVLLQKGYKVSGSDRQESQILQKLQAAGARVFIDHNPGNIAGADLVVRSSAIKDDNVEVQAAFASGVVVLKRAEFLAPLMEGQKCIAVAGTHGKTTTTAMVAWVLTVLEQEPSYIIGGVSLNLGNNARYGSGPWFVIEADEYDGMFLGLLPQIAVITNIEHDHPDCYPTEQVFHQAFEEFAGRVLENGWLVACADDDGVVSLLEEIVSLPIIPITYGIQKDGSVPSTDVDYLAVNLHTNTWGGTSFDMIDNESNHLVTVNLCLPGEHNVRNALAALVVAILLDLDLELAAGGLSEFKGTGRRFEFIGEVGDIAIIDDYAHHPTEIMATLAAARMRYPGARIWALWQPHTYSRTRTLFDNFVDSFNDADCVLVTEVYPAREASPQDGFSSQLVVNALSSKRGPEYSHLKYVPNLDSARDYLLANLMPGDVLLVLSAGDANILSADLLRMLSERNPLDRVN